MTNLLPFQEQISVQTEDGLVQLRLFPLGDLVLPSGKIIACDPFGVEFGKMPFERKVATGKYPVFLSIISYSTQNERVAFARIQFIPDIFPKRWEMATCQGQQINTLKQSQFFAYGVDSGTGCFLDQNALPLLAELVKLKKSDNPFDLGRYLPNQLTHALEKTYVHTWSWTNFPLDSATGLNVMAFSSGWGDGTYPSFWGLDEKDEVVCLVTDFMILADEHMLLYQAPPHLPQIRD